MPDNAFRTARDRQNRDQAPRPDQGPTRLLPKAFRIRQGLFPRPENPPSGHTVHAGVHGRPIQGEAARTLVDQLLERPRRQPGVAYVHLPYCETHCLYCGFFGGRHSPAKAEQYLAALLAEIESESVRPAVRQTPVRAVYLGGGTPTALSARQLRCLLSTLRRRLPLADDCEITVEGRVHNFTDEKMAACLEAGANRFSLGVQTFDSRIRRSLGRIDSRAPLIARLDRLNALAKTRGHQAALVIDLIYGLPGQTLDHWRRDLELFLDLGLDGVDLYRLKVFPQGQLAAAIASGRIEPPVALSVQARYFAAGVRRLQTAGLRRLSVNHWGRAPLERNLYNPMVKGRCDTLAYGCAAGGHLAGHAFHNARDARQYLELQAEKGKKPVAMATLPPPHLEAARSLLRQMEHGRIDWPRFERDSGCRQAAALFGPLIRHWQEAGVALADDSGLELTLAGQFWQPDLCQLLLNWLDMHLEKWPY
jgi:oxygen-independent coproporphyrinogen-3 oxidase